MSYSETQYFLKTWYWMLLAIITLLGSVGYLSSAFSELYETKEALIGLIVKGTLFLLIIGIGIMRLDITADAKGLSYRMWPFNWRHKFVAWDDLAKIELRTYRPLSEFGGWGWRYGRYGRALNVWGNRGIQLYFKNGDKLLLGTQKSKDWEAILPKLAPQKMQ